MSGSGLTLLAAAVTFLLPIAESTSQPEQERCAQVEWLQNTLAALEARLSGYERLRKPLRQESLGEEDADVEKAETSQGTLWVASPTRPGLTTSRKRVLRGRTTSAEGGKLRSVDSE